jgi:hypothetical protein
MHCTFYRQCTLSKGSAQQVAWIPEAFANKGAVLYIEDEYGWVVDEVGVSRESEDHVLAHEQDHLGHRSRTDV